MTGQDDNKRRRARNYALAAALIGMVVLFYSITIVKMSGAVP